VPYADTPSSVPCPPICPASCVHVYRISSGRAHSPFAIYHWPFSIRHSPFPFAVAMAECQTNCYKLAPLCPVQLLVDLPKTTTPGLAEHFPALCPDLGVLAPLPAFSPPLVCVCNSIMPQYTLIRLLNLAQLLTIEKAFWWSISKSVKLALW